MKSYFVSLFAGLALVVGGCAQDIAAPIVTPVVRSYPVNPTVSAMNISIGDKDFNIESNKDGWGGRASSSWAAERGIPTVIQHSNTFTKMIQQPDGSQRKDVMFAINSPNMPIIDPEDPTLKFEKSYNYPALLKFFRPGKFPIQVTVQDQLQLQGFYLWMQSMDYDQPQNSYSYETSTTTQDGSKWELVKVDEVYGQGFYATFSVDCKVKSAVGNKVERMVGTIQLLYRYRPFD